MSRWKGLTMRVFDIRRLLAAAALALSACGSADTEDAEAPACHIQATGPGRLICHEGGCQATFVGCGGKDPGPERDISCVPFPELGEWRCYW